MGDLGRILIADDEETFRNSIADLLRRGGYQCDCAPDAIVAAELLRSIDVLEKTKSAFKSKELGNLRRNLEELVKDLR